MLALLLFGIFFLLLIIGVPISLCLAMASILACVITGDIPSMVLIQKMFRGVDSFTLMAIPFFVFAGNIMARGGVSQKLVDLAGAFVGRVHGGLHGGLAVVGTIACTFFGAISGSGPATTAAVGAIMIDPMEKEGYDKPFSAASVAASGTIGLLIPPSNNMVLYGAIAGASIGKMFLGGIVPGILMALTLSIVEVVISRKRGYSGGQAVSLGNIAKAFKNGIFAIAVTEEKVIYEGSLRVETFVTDHTETSVGIMIEEADKRLIFTSDTRPGLMLPKATVRVMSER